MKPDPRAFAELAREPIRRASGMELDYSSTSLAAVDHFLTTVPALSPEKLAELAGQIGCYFGEVLAHTFGASWEGSPAEDPRTWKLTFASAPLSVHPVGMAAEAIWKEEIGEYDGSLQVAPAYADLLERALAGMGEVDETYYFSLTGRLETIQHVLDVLTSAAAHAGVVAPAKDQ